MRTSWTVAGAAALAVGLFGQATAAPLPANEIGAPAIAKPVVPGRPTIENKTGLPLGAAPVQVLASLDKDGKVVVKNAIITGRFIPNPVGPPSGAKEVFATLQTRTFDLADVKALDNRGKTLDNKALARLLKKETVAMASLYGQPVDPLHLRVLKDGIVTLILPSPKVRPVGRPSAIPGGPGGVPVPLPPLGAPAGVGIAVPGIAVPANPAPNR
jgi:hypothetical protein